jgi:hypothetical protein
MMLTPPRLEGVNPIGGFPPDAGYAAVGVT